MRIGIVTGEYPPMQGGVGAYSQIIARTLTQQGHKVFVFSRSTAKNDDPRLILTNRAENWQLGSLRAVRQWTQQEKLDVVNIQFQTVAYGMSPFIHFLPDYLRGIPVVTTFHDLRFPYLFPKAGRLRDWIVMHLARASAGVIVTNHEDYERIKHLPKATMISIGSNILTELPPDSDRNEWRARAGAKSDDYLIAFFGFMNRSKGVETLLHSVAHLIADKVPAKLVLIGGRTGTSDPNNAAFADEIEKLIVQLRLSDVIYWTGFVNEADVSAYLAASDVVALPFLDGASFRRGTLMAAIQHGSAIVTTTPSVPIAEFVDRQNMYLTPRDDQRALSDALKQLYQSPETRAKLRQGAKELSHKFDWNNIAADTISFFERVLHA